MTEEPLAFARRRLKAGASDAEVRLELLERDVDAERIEVTMRSVTPKRSVSWPLMLAGLALCGIGLGVFALQAAAMWTAGAGSSDRLGIVIGVVGAIIFARGFVPRG